MSYFALLERARRQSRLCAAMLELTYSCNLDCVFCYNDRELPGQDLSLTQYIELLDHLEEMGVLDITLTGGEPLAHPNFFEIGRACRERSFVVRIKSNGHALRPSVIERLRREVDPFVMDISLHGDNPITHDRQTQVPGSFDRLMRNLRLLVDAGQRVTLKTPVTKWNEQELDGIFAIAKGFGLRLECDTQLSPRDNGDPSPMQLAPSLDGVRRMESLYRTMRAEMNLTASSENAKQTTSEAAAEQTSGHHCGAGLSSVTVDPKGNVLPCVQWRRPIGNLHQQSIKQIWNESHGLKEVRELTREVKTWLEDAVAESAQRGSFCPANALRQTGQVVNFYPAFIQRLNAAE